MKKILIILTLTGLSSCDIAPTVCEKPWIITFKDDSAIDCSNCRFSYRCNDGEWGNWFCDKCEAYQVGDTIK